jgi:hypothetical protein
MKLINIIFLFILSHSVYGQNLTDTVYFDNLNRRCFPDDHRMTHYRVLDLKNANQIYVTEYSAGNIIIMTGFYESKNMESANGIFTYYYPSGNIKSSGKLIKNKKEGIHNLYYDLPNNELHLTQNYKKDKLDGLIKGYYPDKTNKRSEIYNNGKFVSGNCYTHSGADTIYYPFFKEATFPGGEEELSKFIKKNVVYPEKEKESGAIGTVLVSFEISETGSVENIIVLKDDPLAPGFTNEVIRVLSLMLKWEPYLIDQIPARQVQKLPITFSIRMKNSHTNSSKSNLEYSVYIGYPKYQF